MEKNNTNDLEHRIIEAAKEVFVENGYAETSMSDIAARVGINRPTLHYYFRTKDRMFKAVFGSILEELAPMVQDIVKQRDTSVEERVEKVVDTYYGVFKQTPTLPMFLMREVKRDFDFVVNFVTELHFDRYFGFIRQEIQAQMDEGLIAHVPMRFLFLTFYSMLTMPFSLKPICERMMLDKGESYEQMLDKWEKVIIRNITMMLRP